MHAYRCIPSSYIASVSVRGTPVYMDDGDRTCHPSLYIQVGKTSFIHRFIWGPNFNFSEAYSPTISLDPYRKRLMVLGEMCNVAVWDITGKKCGGWTRKLTKVSTAQPIEQKVGTHQSAANLHPAVLTYSNPWVTEPTLTPG